MKGLEDHIKNTSQSWTKVRDGYMEDNIYKQSN